MDLGQETRQQEATYGRQGTEPDRDVEPLATMLAEVNDLAANRCDPHLIAPAAFEK